jgi:arsenate reductase
MKILFLCTGNSCRSQMAEAWGRHLKTEGYQFFSAGIKKHGLNSRMLQVMQEASVTTDGLESNLLDELSEQHFDVIVTVCSHAHETCPLVPGATTVHYGFDDPPTITKGMSDEQAILDEYRRVRDEIKQFILRLDEFLPAR